MKDNKSLLVKIDELNKKVRYYERKIQDLEGDKENLK